MEFQFDKYSRFQKGLHSGILFPAIHGECACGCGVALSGRKKKWASPDCQRQAYIHTGIIQGDTTIIRWQLFNRDKGACRRCGEIVSKWHADHIVPVHKGGGACGLDNFQTLCVPCHKEKTLEDMSC